MPTETYNFPGPNVPDELVDKDLDHRGLDFFLLAEDQADTSAGLARP